MYSVCKCNKFDRVNLWHSLKTSTAKKKFWLCRLQKTSTAKSFFGCGKVIISFWLWKMYGLILRSWSGNVQKCFVCRCLFSNKHYSASSFGILGNFFRVRRRVMQVLIDLEMNFSTCKIQFCEINQFIHFWPTWQNVRGSFWVIWGHLGSIYSFRMLKENSISTIPTAIFKENPGLRFM